jgi:hypothetical protein
VSGAVDISSTDPDVTGWLLVATLPGTEPSTRRIVETWAASFSDQDAAIKAVKSAAGTAAVVVLIPLVEETLRGMNITEAGKAARIGASF